jgi:energy-coupling factor transporter ATP-binding protein EcfA2
MSELVVLDEPVFSQDFRQNDALRVMIRKLLLARNLESD